MTLRLDKLIFRLTCTVTLTLCFVFRMRNKVKIYLLREVINMWIENSQEYCHAIWWGFLTLKWWYNRIHIKFHHFIDVYFRSVRCVSPDVGLVFLSNHSAHRCPPPAPRRHASDRRGGSRANWVTAGINYEIPFSGQGTEWLVRLTTNGT